MIFFVYAQARLFQGLPEFDVQVISVRPTYFVAREACLILFCSFGLKPNGLVKMLIQLH